jgi:pimeloyl-ACP methyl ester carboxylesterase
MQRSTSRGTTIPLILGYTTAGCVLLSNSQPSVSGTPGTAEAASEKSPRRAAPEVSDRIHRAVSADGTEIVGRVVGRGPPLVLVHGGLGDGESSWDAMVPLLADSFTCYLMSTRGRGSSATPAEPDYALERLAEDVVAFVEAIGEPAYLVGYSLGGAVALAAAARSGSVAAVAVYEPPVFEVHEGDAHVGRMLAMRVGEATEEGRWADAARFAVEAVARKEELAALSEGGVFEAWAPNMPVALREMAQAASPGTVSPTAPESLSRIGVPVLYLLGSLTPNPWYRNGAEHVAAHADDVRLLELEGTGHFAPRLAPQPLAFALVTFFSDL